VDEGILSDLTVQPYAPIELERPASSVNLDSSFSDKAEYGHASQEEYNDKSPAWTHKG
jgi:hypothetical protein